MTATSRERVEAALRHQEPDRTPIFEYVLLSPLADRLLGRRYAADPANWAAAFAGLGWERAVRQNALDRLDLAERLGHDMLYVTPNPMPPSDGAPSPSTAPDRGVLGLPPSRAPARARNRSGPSNQRRSSKSTRKSTSTTRPDPGGPHDLGPYSPPPPTEPVEDPVERVRRRNEAAARSSPVPPDETRRVYVELKAEMARRGIDLPILAPAWAHGVWTDVDLMQTMLLAPEVAHEHFRQATRRSLAAAESYIALGIGQIGVGGDFAGNRPLISPEAYRTFIVPEIRTVVRRIHEAGCHAVNASDGDLWSVLDDFLLGCEVDGYAEIDFHAGMDLRRLKAAYGDRITFYGNLDCGNVLSFGTVDDVRRHTVECLEAGLGNGGHILCVSNAITASVPLANYLAIVGAYRDVSGLPPLNVG